MLEYVRSKGYLLLTAQETVLAKTIILNKSFRRIIGLQCTDERINEDNLVRHKEAANFNRIDRLGIGVRKREKNISKMLETMRQSALLE